MSDQPNADDRARSASVAETERIVDELTTAETDVYEYLAQSGINFGRQEIREIIRLAKQVPTKGGDAYVSERQNTGRNTEVELSGPAIAAPTSNPEARQSDTPRTWAEEMNGKINALTPDIKGKAFDPDWFLLWQDLNQMEEKLAAVTAERDKLTERSVAAMHIAEEPRELFENFIPDCPMLEAVLKLRNAHDSSIRCAHCNVTVVENGGRCNNCGADVFYDKESRNWVEDTEQQRELAAVTAERDKALQGRCDECGASIINDCSTCGAPQCCPQCCKIDEQQQEIARLKEELHVLRVKTALESGELASKLAEAQRDTERLDWLENQFDGSRSVFSTSLFIAHELGGGGLVLDQKMRDVVVGNSVRQLIDIATMRNPSDAGRQQP